MLETNMDCIRIKRLAVFAHHGVYAEENKLGQQFVISAALFLDCREAGKTDDLSKSLNYAVVSHCIKSFVEGHTFQLIETVAERLAEKLLRSYPPLRAVRVEIEKPWAPIGLPLECVSVDITRGWHTAYIALGSNMGDRAAFLSNAVEQLRRDESCRLGKVSEFIVTKPYGPVAQEDFLNGCLVVETLLTPPELLHLLQEIEQSANRERTVHWGPRTLDLDILLYDDLVFNSDELCIPHREMHKRDFVLKPLCSIAPNLLHPITRKTIGELLESLESAQT